jgi:DMSO/TMAO reductase YedYZ molybdopterin-dependent catalytic subunit
LPPGQRALDKLRAMGGQEGDGEVKSFRLKVHGLCKQPFEVDYAGLLKLPQVTKEADVHCVTGWSLIGHAWKGVQIATLAEIAGIKSEARYVIMEAAHGYTANVPLKEATADNALVTYRLDDKPFAIEHGAPVRGLVPDLYFWKSAKWLTGLRFVKDDQPGYWETRGYHNHADPWKEERYG